MAKSKSKNSLPKSGKTVRHPFPEVAKSISEAIQFHTAGKKMSLADIAHKLGISHVSLNRYKQGTHVPPQHIADKLVDYFYGSDIQRASELRKVLDDSARLKGRISDTVLSSRKPLDRLARGEELRVSKNDFWPFSPFLDHTCDRLLELGTLTKATPPPRGGFDIRDALWQDLTDLAIGFFATVSRSVLTHAWSTPIRLGLGVVIDQEDATKTEIETIQKILTRAKPIDLRFHPIVVRHDVGAVHCLETLKYKEGPEASVVDAPDELGTAKTTSKDSPVVEKLIDAFKIKKDVPGVVPMIVVNEYLSFEVLQALNNKEIPAKPALPLFSREQARKSPRRELPAYFLSISCSRRDMQFRDMIHQLLLLFLATEVEATSFEFAKLQDTLLDKLRSFTIYYGLADKASQFKAAFNWTLYALGLDRYSIANYPSGGLPWRAILQRTRDRVLEKLGYNEDTIRAQIRLAAGNDNLLSQEKFRQLCDSLDLDIELNDVQSQYVLEDTDILTRTIANILQGIAVPLPIEYDESGKPKAGGRINLITLDDADNIRVVEGFLVELNNFYSDHIKSRTNNGHMQENKFQAVNSVTDKSVLGRLELFRSDLLKFAKNDSKDERVILASIGKAVPRHIGCAFVRPYDEEIEKRPKVALELFYLWVPQNYQKLAVGAHIIREAQIFAKERGYQYLVIEVIRTLNDAVTYFLRRGFEPASDYTELRKPERWVMRYRLP